MSEQRGLRKRRARRFGRALVPLGVSGVLLAAGCGSSKSSSSPTTQATSGTSGSSVTAPAPQLLDPPVKLGALIPLTGTGLNYPYYLTGVEAAVKGMNAAGGIKGHRVVLDECDDRNDPNQAGSCARQMVSDGVIAVAASETLFGNVISPILTKAGIPQFVNGLGPTDFDTPGVFPIGAGSIASVVGNVMVAKKLGVASIGVVVAAGATSAEALQLVEGAAKVEGLKVAYAGTIPATATDLSSYAESAIKSGAKIVMAPLIESQEIAFLQASQQLGAQYTVGYAAVGLTDKDFASLKGNSVLEGALFGGSVPPYTASQTTYPALKDYIADMRLQASSGDKLASADLDNNGTELEWFSTYLAGVAANQVSGSGVPTAATFLQYLDVAQNIQNGLLPPWTPGAKGPGPFSRVTQPYDYDIRIHNGALTLAGTDPLNIFQGLGLAS